MGEQDGPLSMELNSFFIYHISPDPITYYTILLLGYLTLSHPEKHVFEGYLKISEKFICYPRLKSEANLEWYKSKGSDFCYI